MTALYPSGYGTDRLTMDQLKSRHQSKMHPEYARRLFNWIAAQRGLIGIGSSWRATPHPVSRASMNGESFHQDQPWREAGPKCTAVDLVAFAGDGTKHRAPKWSEVIRQGAASADVWGVHCNIDHESWHMQPIETDGYRTWMRAGRPELFHFYPIPGNPFPTPTPPQAGMPPFKPEQGLFSLWPLNKGKPRLANAEFVRERVGRGFDDWTSRGDAVKYLQGVILHKAGGNIKVDGDYGPLTEGRVLDLQKWFKLYPDGLVGSQSWGLIDALSQT